MSEDKDKIEIKQIPTDLGDEIMDALYERTKSGSMEMTEGQIYLYGEGKCPLCASDNIEFIWCSGKGREDECYDCGARFGVLVGENGEKKWIVS